jgi:hypothetical protein
LHAIQDQKGNIAGFCHGELLDGLTRFSPTRQSRQLRRLLDLGVTKQVIGTYRYHLQSGPRRFHRRRLADRGHDRYDTGLIGFLLLCRFTESLSSICGFVRA